MLFTKSLLFAGAFVAAANAAVVEVFSDQNCQNSKGTTNVWDNSCDTNMPNYFQSFKITEQGGHDQQITAYIRNACAGAQGACHGATQVGQCFTSFGANGASNALGSSTHCGVV